MKLSLKTVKFVSSFIILTVGVFGENLENYDHSIELSTIKLLYYHPTVHEIDNPIEITGNETNIYKEIENNFTDVKLLIHGWTASPQHVAMEPVRNAYLRKKSSHLLMADWSDVASQRYFIARDMIAPVGKRICHLLKIFAKHANITADKIHIISHSLGAHVATHLGRCYNGEIGRLTALDPAGPLFTPFSIDALNRNDALFVDTIHTSAGLAGEFETRAHVDFFPNSGKAPMNGCEKLDVLTVTACSHYRAPLYFSESILIPDSFPAHKCELSLIQSAAYRNCLNGSNVVLMGENIDRNARGVFYLETFATFPYGKGL